MSQYLARIDAFMEAVKARNGHEPEFLQAVEEVAEAVIAFIAENPKYDDSQILNRIVEWTKEGIVYEADQRHGEIVW